MKSYPGNEAPRMSFFYQANVDLLRRVLAEDEVPEAVIAEAAALRDRGWGRAVTYSRKVFLPVTNLCRDRCSYCPFRKDPDDPGAFTAPRRVGSALARSCRSQRQ